jgi:hypothetical protein
MKSLQRLAKDLDFNEDVDYFDYCMLSYINGQMTQCKTLFAQMKREDRKGLLQYINSREVSKDKEIYQFYFNLL